MQFSTSAAVLRDALATARHATPTSPALVAYSGVLLRVKAGKLSVVGSDGEVTIAALGPVTDATDGQVLLPPRPLGAYLTTLDPDTTVVVTAAEGADVSVTAGRLAPYQFRPVAATFPLPPTSRAKPTPVNFERLAAALGAVRPATPREGFGVQLVSDETGLRLNATDNYRLHSAQLPEAGFGEFSGLCPVSVLDRVVRHQITGVTADARGRSLRFSGPDIVVSARLLSAPFPAVEAILGADLPVWASVERDPLRAALARLAAVAEAAPLTVRSEGAELVLAVSNADLGSGEERVPLAAEPLAAIDFAADRGYLADAVAAHPAERFEIGFAAAHQPVVLRSTDPFETTTVVMPIRV